MTTVAPRIYFEPPGGFVFATVPGLPPAGTGCGDTWGTKPAAARIFCASATVLPRTSGTVTGLPAATFALLGGKSLTGVPATASFIACCQIGPGRVAPKIRE